MSEPRRLDAPQYAIDPSAPFPKRWRDHIGPLRVMGEPIQGWVMVRRPHAVPFCIRVPELLNADPHPTAGPFLLAEPANRRTDHG